jgi:hypothetical protein
MTAYIKTSETTRRAPLARDVGLRMLAPGKDVATEIAPLQLKHQEPPRTAFPISN